MDGPTGQAEGTPREGSGDGGRVGVVSPRIWDSFARLIQDASDIISVFDPEGTVLYQSPSVEALLGHRAAERVGKNIFRDPICHPDDRPAKRAFIDSCLDQPGASVSARFRLRHADGGYREVEAVGRNLLDDPDLRGIIAYYRDVTEEAKTQRAMAHLAAIIESSADAIISKDLDGIITSWNSAAERLYGYKEEEIVGRPVVVLIPGDRRQEEVAILERIRRGERIEHFDSVRVCKSGRLVRETARRRGSRAAWAWA